MTCREARDTLRRSSLGLSQAGENLELLIALSCFNVELSSS